MSRLPVESAREITTVISAFASDAVCAAALSQDLRQPASNALPQRPKNATVHVARVRPNCSQHIGSRYRSIRSRMLRSVWREGFVQRDDQKDCLPGENRSLNFGAQRTAVRSAVRLPTE